MKRLVVVMAVAMLGTAVSGDDVTGSEKLLCSASRIIGCYEEGDCAELFPEEIGVPQFVVIDTEAQRVSTTRASGENRSTSLGEVNRADGLMFFQGIERGRAFSFVVHEQTGHLTVAVSRDGLSVSVFGSCTDAGDADI
jgi:hypothetical protein